MSDVTALLEWIAIVVLICFSGLFSGLNLGLMSLDTVGLEIIMASDNQAHVAAAQKIKPLRDRGNWLLCTLLLGNVAVNAELSILLADKTSGTIGFLVSTVLIVIFGEIVPQALCSRYALEIGAKTIYIVWPLMVLMAPAAWPVSWILDQVLGEELGTIYSNKELSKLVDITARHRPDSMSNLNASMLKGALQLNDKLVADVYTNMSNVFWLHEDEVLDFDLLARIFKLGHSRIPIFRQNDKSVNYCIGLLYVKDLILIDPDDKLPIAKVLRTFDHHHTPIDVWKYDDLHTVLQLFITKRQHLAFVKDNKYAQQSITEEKDQKAEKTPMNYAYVGIITLEDVIEEILKKELVDEYDNYVDPLDLCSTTPRLKEINWSNSLFKTHHMQADNIKKRRNSASLRKPVQYPQMVPVPVKIEADTARTLDKTVDQQTTPYTIRHSESFKMLGLTELSDYDKRKRNDNDKFQYLQVNYKSITVQIRCNKQTDVQTVNDMSDGSLKRQIMMDGQKIIEINDD